METPAQRIERLLCALENLSQEYQFLFHSSEFDRGLAVQQRCLPVVDEIARLMVQPGVAASLSDRVQERAQRFMTRQLDLLQKLKHEQAAVQDQLQEIGAFQSRSKAFRSAYAPPPFRAQMASMQA